MLKTPPAKPVIALAVVVAGAAAVLTAGACAPAPDAGTGGDSPRTGSIAGRVIRPDGSPEADAPVFAAIRPTPTSDLVVVRATTAAWDGRYEIAGLAPGRYFVGAGPDARAAAEHYLPPTLRLVPSLFPGVGREEPGQPVEVFEEMATEGIDIWLGPSPPRFSLSGRVSWPAALDVDHVTIEYGGPAQARSGIWTVGDPGGLFAIEGVPQGTVVLLARADSTLGPLRGMAATHVALQSVEEVRIALTRPGAVEGRLVPESDAANAHLRVRLVPVLLQPSPLFGADEGDVGRDGSFAIPHALGQYRVEVLGLPDAWRVARVVHDGADLTGPLVVTPGERVRGVEVHVGR
jgi:hypothetical protein